MKSNIKTNYIDLARFVGIYAVVLGHFTPFIGIGDDIGRKLLYAFHVPLFFVVSGILSKPTPILKSFYSLMIPYLIYNVLSIIKMDFKALFTFDSLELNNSPTWFFPALFFIKIIANYIHEKIPYFIAIIIGSVTFLYYFNIEIPRLFGLHAVVYGLPFFLLGKFIKDKIEVILSVRMGALICCGVLLLCVCLYNKRFDLYSSQIHNPIVYFISSGMASIWILAICKRVFIYIPNTLHQFIYTNSRGTMFILGTHYIALGVLSKYIIPGIHLSFLLKSLIVALSSIPYYYIIRYTYNRWPILYGR